MERAIDTHTAKRTLSTQEANLSRVASVVATSGAGYEDYPRGTTRARR
jgi:hypothetical protein